MASPSFLARSSPASIRPVTGGGSACICSATCSARAPSRSGPVVSDDVIAAMADAGLVGLEVDHPDHDAVDRARAAALVRDLGLIGTGSSDYHGTNKSTQLGDCTTAPDAYERLMALPSAHR